MTEPDKEKRQAIFKSINASIERLKTKMPKSIVVKRGEGWYTVKTVWEDK